jgi:hypothetical protein
MVIPHGHGETLPMSGPGWAGTPIAYRVLGWADQHLREAHDALCIIREETPAGLYPRDLLHGGGRHALVNAGLLVVTAREVAKAAALLAEACAELDSRSFATLQAETAPPTILQTEARLPAVEVFLAAAEHVLDLPTSPFPRDDCSAPSWLDLRVGACRLAATLLIASGWLDTSEQSLVQGAMAPFEARREPICDA